MKQNRLVPIKMQNITNNNTESPLERMRARLDRQTKFWPITLTSTFIFNIPNVSYIFIFNPCSVWRIFILGK